MLKRLCLNNFFLIPHLDLDFQAGFTVITGETGAGKSVLLEALDLVLGGKPNRHLFLNPAHPTQLIAEFEVDQDASVCTTLDSMGIGCDDGHLVFRRSIHPDGKSRFFINDIPTTVTSVRVMSESMIEWCGQHQSQSLLQPSTYLSLLDHYGQTDLELDQINEAHQRWISLKKKLEDIVLQQEKQHKRLLELRQCCEAIEPLGLQPGELDQLEQSKKLLQERRHWLELGDKIKQIYLGQHGIEERIGQLQRLMSKFSEQPFLGASQELWEQVRPMMDEALRPIWDMMDNLQAETRSLDEIQDRLYAIKQLCRQYQVTTTDELLDLYQKFHQEILDLESMDHRLTGIQNELDQARDVYQKCAEILHQKRTEASIALSQAVMAGCRDMHMPHLKFRVDVTSGSLDQATHRGTDWVDFLISTNPGIPLKPLKSVASGGELSRILLVLRAVLGQALDASTYVFDEIDSGVGGKVASSMGLFLRQLGQNKQVLSITHSPYVAAMAHQHIKVEKQSDGHQTQISIRMLDSNEQHRELVHMLSGGYASDEEADQLARSLLNHLKTGTHA